MKTPKISRPHMPGYGLQPAADESQFLPWDFVTTRMQAARNYWLATATPAGDPHTAPIWGIWHQNVFYFSTGTTSRKYRNLAHKPRCILHLESGDEVVILEGNVETVSSPDQRTELNKIYHQKYQVTLVMDDNPVYSLKPAKALAWLEHDFPNTATRWEFS